jgi:uncharacterized membrane protein
MNQNSSVNGKPDINVTVPERVVSVLAGTFLLYRALKKRNLGIINGAAAGFLLYRGLSGNCPAYGAMGKKKLADPVKNINIRTTVTVNKPRHEVYAFWRKLDNLPLFMKHLHSVEVLDDKQSQWKARIPGGFGTIQWKAEITKDEDESLLGWNSLPGATIENAGKVMFKDAGENGTEIHAVISYRAPLGAVGEGVARLLNQVFEDMVKEDIRNFKRYIETGEIPTIEGQPSGRNKLHEQDARSEQGTKIDPIEDPQIINKIITP